MKRTVPNHDKLSTDNLTLPTQRSPTTDRRQFLEWTATALASTAMGAACATTTNPKQDPARPIALVGATVIDGTGGIITDATVMLRATQIEAVGPRESIPLPPDAETIDLEGKTVIPGLIDCHAHVGVLPDNSFFQVEDTVGLTDLFMTTLLRQGVTTVRDPGNFDPDAVFRLLKAGRPNWPRFFGAGKILDGPADPPAPWRWLETVDTEAAGRAKAAELVVAGMDFLKVYVWTRLPVLQAIVEEAHRWGIPVAAHVGNKVTVEEAVRAGVDALEHVRIGRELVSKEQLQALEGLPVRATDALSNFRYWRYIDPQSAKADALIALMAERGTFFTPTLTLSQSILKGNQVEGTQPPGIDTMPAPVRTQWDRFAYPFDYSDEDWAQAPIELSTQMQFVGRALQGGVRVTAGTDCTNPYVVPGYSFHEELRLLVEGCGIAPMEALIAGTRRAAELVGQAETLGTVEPGKLADLVVLNQNPLDNIRHTTALYAVYKDGQAIAV